MKKIWNKIVGFEFKKNGESSLREKEVKGLAGFIVLMIVLTILSRTADSMTIAQVTTGKTEKKTIDRFINSEGYFEENKEIPVATVEGIKIDEVAVSQSTSVKQGDLLLRVNMDDLNEKIGDKEREINTLATSISNAEQAKAQQNSQKSTQQSRLYEDYVADLADADALINSAYQKMQEAETNLRNFDTNPPTAGEEEEPLDLASMRKDLADAYDLAKSDYDTQVKNKNSITKTYNRAVEDAKNETTVDDNSTLEESKIDKEKKEKELKELTDLRDAEGKVFAPIDGVVTQIAAAAGDLTTGSKELMIADMSGGLKFAATVSKTDRKYLAVGDTATLKLASGQEIENLEIDSIADGTEPDTYKVTILVEGTKEISMGASAEMRVELSSKTYSSCVPLAALRGSEKDYYILVVEEKESVLGNQQIARKYAVTVLEKSETYAAIDEWVISSNQDFVLDANKEVADGDRIRVQAGDTNNE